jgi:GNAT superfamily N-acetyltransferase
LAGPPESCADARVKYEVRPLNLAANRALGGRWVEVYHAANHAKFGPRAQRTTLADVLAVPGRRHEQWQCFAGYAGDKLVGAGAAITTRDNPHVGTMWLSVHPDHQGRGLGGALLAEIERDLRERGCSELLVHATETSDGGGASPHFAARYGFRETLLTLMQSLDLSGWTPSPHPLVDIDAGTLPRSSEPTTSPTAT